MNIKLQDLTFGVIQQLFADVLSQKYGQLNFPNASDSTTTVRNERDLENWKTGIMNGYGNIELELNPETANSREQIKVLDPKFLANKNRYIDAKASYLDSERSAGRTSGLDEELINEFGPDAKDEMSPSEYIQYCLEQYREYTILAMDPTINDQASKLYLEKASDYYARAQEAMDEIEPDMTDHLSDEDKALPNVPMNELDINRWAKLAGINEALDAQSLIGKYVTLSQSVGMSGYHPKTAQDVIDIMPKFTNPAFGIKIHDTDPGKASWGSAVYLIQQDGSLKTVSSNYDTSG